MRTYLLHLVAAPLLLAAACHGAKKVDDTAAPPPPLHTVLPTLPFPPDYATVASQSGVDATQIVLSSPHSVDSVAAYYRKVLAEPPFHLVNETTSGGVISFLADQSGPSLWVTVQSDGKSGSQVVLAGGAVDSTKKGDSTRKKGGG